MGWTEQYSLLIWMMIGLIMKGMRGMKSKRSKPLGGENIRWLTPCLHNLDT
jgi:hypothetical protein